MSDIDTLKLESRLMRQRNERLEAIPAQIIARLERGFGASHAAPLMIRREFLGAEPKPVEKPFAWATHHDEPMLFLTEKEAAMYCDEDEEPIPLYAPESEKDDS